MPTRHINPSSQLPPPPATDAEVIHALRDLITQLQNTQNERGLAINSLISGFFGAIHLGYSSALTLASGGTTNQLAIEEGIAIVPLSNIGAASHTINGIAAPVYPGRVICLSNVSFTLAVTLNNENAGAAAADRLHLGATSLALAARTGIFFWYWPGNVIFPEGRWVRMAT